MAAAIKFPLSVLLIASAALALAAFLLWPTEDPPADFSDREAGRSEQFTPLEPESVRREGVASESGSDLARKDGPVGREYLAPTGQVTLIGRVVDEAGRPRVGASVWVELFPHRPFISKQTLARRRTTADGSFRLKGLQPEEEYQVHATQEGYLPAISKTAEPDPGETFDLGELVLQSSCRVRGRVVSAAGDSISGATVKRWPDRKEPGSLTDIEGRFVLDNLPAGKVNIGAEAPGFVSGLGRTPFSDTGRLALDLRPGEQREDLVIILKQEGIIRGGIVGPDGAPIVGERFLISARINQTNATFLVAETVSNAGAFVLAGLDPDRAYDLLALGLSGRRQARLDTRSGTEVVFEFQPLPVVQVAVRSQQSGAILRPGSIVLRRAGENVCSYSPWTWHDRREDDPPPIVMLPYQEAGTHELVVAKHGFVSFESEPLVLDGQTAYGPITVRLREEPPAGPAITGIVRQARSREPLAGVKVLLVDGLSEHGRDPSKLHGVLVTGVLNRARETATRTDQDGRFAFAEGRAPLSLVLINARHDSSYLDLPTGSSQHDLELLAHESGAIEGRVTLVDGGAGAGLPIVADRPDAAPRTTKTDDRGEFRLAPLLPGLWYVSAGNPQSPRSRRSTSGIRKWSDPTALDLAVKVTVPEGRFATAKIDLGALGAALRGTVRVNGLTRSKLSVTLTLADRPPGSPGNQTVTHVAWTGSAGDYAFPVLPTGSYQATVRSDRGQAVLAATTLVLLRGQTLRHHFNIRLGRLTVTVLEQDTGQPIPAAQVQAVRIPGPGEDASGTSRISARTNAEGRALLLGLTADQFSLIIRTERGILGRRVTVPPGGRPSLTVHVPLPSTLRIILEDAEALETNLVTIDLHFEGQKIYTHYILGPVVNPSLTLPDIQPGNYEVRAFTEGGAWTAEGAVEVIFGEQNSVTLKLEPTTPTKQDQ